MVTAFLLLVRNWGSCTLVSRAVSLMHAVAFGQVGTYRVCPVGACAPLSELGLASKVAALENATEKRTEEASAVALSGSRRARAHLQNDHLLGAAVALLLLKNSSNSQGKRRQKPGQVKSLEKQADNGFSAEWREGGSDSTCL